SFAIGIASMARLSCNGFEQWAYGIGRSRHGRPGKTDTRRGSSARSDGIVLTMLFCSAKGICAICSIPTKNITTRLAHTYRCTRTRRSRVPSRPSVERWRCQFWADCTTNISERKFPTGTSHRPHAQSVVSFLHCMNDPQPEGSHGKLHRTTKI